MSGLLFKILYYCLASPKVYDDEGLTVLVNILHEKLKLSKQKLILSVTGGAKNFTIPFRMRKAFKEGFNRVANLTGTYIITGGTNVGIMRLIGEAVSENPYNDNNIPVIGIVTWGIIEGRQNIKLNEDFKVDLFSQIK